MSGFYLENFRYRHLNLLSGLDSDNYLKESLYFGRQFIPETNNSYSLFI